MIMPAEELERELADQKAVLAGNLAELAHQAKELVDWRAQTRKHPRGMMGAAFAGGLLLAIVAGGQRSAPTRRRRSASASGPTGSAEPSFEEPVGATDDPWQVLKGALLGAASARVMSYVAEMLPEFREHLESQRQGRSPRNRASRAPAAERNAEF